MATRERDRRVTLLNGTDANYSIHRPATYAAAGTRAAYAPVRELSAAAVKDGTAVVGRLVQPGER